MHCMSDAYLSEELGQEYYQKNKSLKHYILWTEQEFL